MKHPMLRAVGVAVLLLMFQSAERRAVAVPVECNATRTALSDLGEAVLRNIEISSAVQGKSPVPLPLIFSTCNELEAVLIDGPQIFGGIRDAIAQANHEVDMAFYQWDLGSEGIDLIGDGLIAAQARRTPSDPLLVRIVIDDLEFFTSDRAVNHLWDSQRRWQARGLDTSRVKFQFGTSPREVGGPNLHDKLVVVDARRVIVTGANPQPAHNSPAPWHDSAYVLEGDVGRSTLAAFEHTWNGDAYHWNCTVEAFSNDCDKRPLHFPQPDRPWLPAFGSLRPGYAAVLAVGRIKESLLSNNIDNPQDVAWLTLMDRAVSNIHVESPNINDDAFRDAIVRAVGRGVTVRLITSLGFNQFNADLPSQGGDNEEVVGDLRNRIRAAYPANQTKFEMRWYSRNAVEPIDGNGAGASHAKYMSVDGRVAIVGSGNMETPAWNWSHEFNLLIDDMNTVASLEAALFMPDWNASIGQYAELYEGNSGTQDLVCPIAVINSNKFVPFTTRACDDNDETRSLLLHDVPAGRVLRFYDDGNRMHQEDDWTEIVVKRSVQRKYVDSYQASFEDADVRVIAHHDDGLDGKVSSAEVASTPIGAVVDLYAGNFGTQSLVCSNRIGGTRTINLTQDPYCNNDAARSLKLYDFPLDKVIFVYDDSGGSTSDDWSLIVPQRPIAAATVGSFQTNLWNTDVRVCVFPDNGLDGKVSRVRIGARSEAYGMCGVTAPAPPACSCGEASCTPITAAYISHYTGADCTGDESYYTPYFNTDGVRRSWDGKGCAGTILRTVTNRSVRNSSGVCTNAWPTGNTLSGFVRVYRSGCNCGEASCQPVQAAYISHFTGLACTGEESYYTPYFNNDGVRRSWDGKGCVGTQLRTLTHKSAKNSAGVCTDAWPNGNTLSGFVRVYR
jgi:phosphatidylserine/phosphatidylglycerophosphate/cardiolipin synthase-like enzyme